MFKFGWNERFVGFVCSGTRPAGRRGRSGPMSGALKRPVVQFVDRATKSRCRHAHRRCLSTVVSITSPRKALDCTNTAQAYRGYTTPELLRGSAVLTACSQQWLVRRSEPLIELSDRVLGENATNMLLRCTVFGHFVAGEDEQGIAPVLKGLHRQGVGGILDYAAEADLDAAEMGSSPSVNQPARAYPFVSQEQCDANMHIFLSAVDAVHATTPEGFAAVKVTALGDPALLERVSSAIVQIRSFFETLDTSGNGVVSRAAFLRGWRQAFDISDADTAELLDRIDVDMDGDVDIIEFTNGLPLQDIGPLVQRCRSRGPLYHSALDSEECSALERMLERLDAIAVRAKSLGVRLMIDAEHTYFQPAIDHAVLRLSRAHNVDYPCVFGTYQAYLVDCHSKLQTDLDRSQREGWHLGAKLVRGAYMVHERARALERGYADPIQPTIEATHASYERAIEALLLHCPNPALVSVMIASHNQNSMERVAALLLADGADASRVPRDRVYFGQLLGMADHLTFTLAGAGFKAYKYVPYGTCARASNARASEAHLRAPRQLERSTHPHTAGTFRTNDVPLCLPTVLVPYPRPLPL